MPPFEYQPVQFPYTNSIASLMARGGDVQAQAIQQAAAARAQGQLGAAQAWGQGIQNVGQELGAIPGQIAQAKQRQVQTALLGTKLQEAQQHAADLKALDAAYLQPGGRDAIINALPGHLRPTVTTQFDQMDKLHADAQKAQEEADRLATDAFADTGASVAAHGYDPGAFQLAVSNLKTKYASNPQRLGQLQQAEAAVQANPTPQTVQQIVDPLIQASPKRVELMLNAQKIQLDQATQAETARHNAENERVASLREGRETASAAEVARHNGIMENISAMGENLRARSEAETHRHNVATELAANPLAALTAGGGTAPAQTGAVGAVPTGTQGQTPPSPPQGQAFLQSLPPAVQTTVKALAEGRMPFPGGFALKSPYWQSMLNMVGQYDPTFDATNYNARNRARTDLESPGGKGGQTINALNTALQHAGRLSDLIETLNNYQSPIANAVVNPLRTAVGQTAVTNYNVVQPQLMKEIERAWRGAGGSTADINKLEDSLGANKGIQQQREGLQEFVNLLKGKLDTTQQQRDTVLGPVVSQQVPVLYPPGQAAMSKIEQRASSGGGAPKTMSIADVQRIAQRSGQSYENAKKYAESQGYIVQQ